MPTSLRGIAKRHREMSSVKRITLKSPVREFRTPGSVGGQSGNWLSYPNGFSQEYLDFPPGISRC